MLGPQQQTGEEGDNTGAKQSLGRRDLEEGLEAKAARIKSGTPWWGSSGLTGSWARLTLEPCCELALPRDPVLFRPDSQGAHQPAALAQGDCL